MSLLLLSLLSVVLAQDYYLAQSSQENYLRVQPGKTLTLEFTVYRSQLPEDVRDPAMLVWRTKGVFFAGERLLRDSIVNLDAEEVDGGWTFVGSWRAPNRESLQYVELYLVDEDGETLQWEGNTILVAQNIRVTCSNGLYCDGQERYVQGKCISGSVPCDDGESCTIDTCTEENGGHCNWELDKSTPSCADQTCGQFKCVLDCVGKECGDNGCNGACGTCGDGEVCEDFICVLATGGAGIPGTCANALPLLSPGETFLGHHEITGDTSSGINLLAPSCNTLSDAKELIYSFVVPEGDYEFVGSVITLSGNNYIFDTVLEVFEDNCGNKANSVSCTDDSTPPGLTGSRAEVNLKPGHTYYVQVDGYSASYAGPFLLIADFFADCSPQCDGNFCLDNGCGSPCYECAAGSICSERTAQCIPENCEPDCNGKECGSDSCDGVCGTCTQGYCEFDVLGDEVLNLGQCILDPVCDNFNPVCAPGCGANSYCGYDCKCHAVDEVIGDLIVRLTDLSVKTEKILETSCSYFEKCTPEIGDRKLMRFTVQSQNFGYADIQIADPKDLPAFFEYSTCHQHWHFRGYAKYVLYDSNDRVIRDGGKQSYCLEDSGPLFEAPWVECSPYFDCGFQGIQRGYTDEYGSSLDCQWLDITDVPDGEYKLEVNINNNYRMHELSIENNYASQYIRIEGDSLTEIDSWSSGCVARNYALLVVSLILLFLSY